MVQHRQRRDSNLTESIGHQTRKTINRTSYGYSKGLNENEWTTNYPNPIIRKTEDGIYRIIDFWKPGKKELDTVATLAEAIEKAKAYRR